MDRIAIKVKALDAVKQLAYRHAEWWFNMFVALLKMASEDVLGLRRRVMLRQTDCL